MTALSFPVVFGVVLVLHSLLFTPVLPSVTPDFDIEIPDGDSKESVRYDTVAYSSRSNRLKRQVTLPPSTVDESLVADKRLLNKNPSAIPSTKKLLIDAKATALPTSSPLDQIPNLQGGTGQSLPTQPDNTNVRGDINSVVPDGNNQEGLDQPFSDEDVLFDGNSTYPHLPQNNTYYENKQNYSITKVDNFRYYTVHSDPDGVRKYWIDMNGNHKAKKHDMLSNAHRRAATVKPNFNISFYGHKVQNLTIATGGFIYLGDQVHAWLAATQYIAPLMANFDSSTSLNATVNYASDDDCFAVEWNQVRLQDSPNVGPFSFQTAIYKNGTIMFMYKQIPIPVANITDSNHPVKVGLSDAYIKDKNLLFVRQKTIYEYDRIDLKSHPNSTITNGTVIIFTPVPTCIEIETCEQCALTETPFRCAWCPATNRCSNGTDRYYQDWTQKGCDKPNGNFTTLAQCIINRRDASSTYNTAGDHNHIDGPNDLHGADEKSSADSYVKKVKTPETDGMSAAGVIGVMFLMMIIFGSVGWLSYAYFFPHSPSGQMLIRYRPSQWGFRRGEARYTAASIHM